MNIRKTLKIITIVAIILLITGLTISLAKIDPNNTYTIEADKTNVKADDIVTVTLRVKIPENSKGIQGRVEYDTNLTFLENEVSSSDYGDYGTFALRHDPDIHAIGFATILQDGFVSGDVMVVKLKFKVTGLVGGDYKIYWKDYDQNGYFEIDSVTLKRTDMVSGSGSGNNQGNNQGANTEIGKENQISIGDIIDAEVTGQNITYNNGTQDYEGQSGNPYTNTGNSKGNLNNNSIILPETGEKLSILIAVVSGILLGVCIYIKTKKLKF